MPLPLNAELRFDLAEHDPIVVLFLRLVVIARDLLLFSAAPLAVALLLYVVVSLVVRHRRRYNAL
jgi:hypothetical protein